ncbi:hypothetical protein FPQ18DRAFT_322229 [Pyronema domesticum]|nr:hypothetical protein FPQ18DRAFT_322229 [Pyronema domesticum]
MKPILFLFALFATATATSLQVKDPVDTEIEKETTDELPKNTLVKRQCWPPGWGCGPPRRNIRCCIDRGHYYNCVDSVCVKGEKIRGP